MSLIPVLLTPLALFLPAAAIERPSAMGAGVEAGAPSPVFSSDPVLAARYGAPQSAAIERAGQSVIFQVVAESHLPQSQFQVRIEQHTTIRVTPLHTPMPVRRSMLSDLPDRDPPERMVERNIGACLRASTISGVRPDTRANRLLLFMRDRRVVSAQLERSCRARDFYSGFYLARSTDGRMCVDRDVLLSRSGANCRVTRMRELVQSGD